MKSGPPHFAVSRPRFAAVRKNVKCVKNRGQNLHFSHPDSMTRSVTPSFPSSCNASTWGMRSSKPGPTTTPAAICPMIGEIAARAQASSVIHTTTRSRTRRSSSSIAIALHLRGGGKLLCKEQYLTIVCSLPPLGSHCHCCRLLLRALVCSPRTYSRRRGGTSVVVPEE